MGPEYIFHFRLRPGLAAKWPQAIDIIPVTFRFLLRKSKLCIHQFRLSRKLIPHAATYANFQPGTQQRRDALAI